MLTLEQALRRAGTIALGLAAASGAAVAQGTPDQPTTDPVSPDDTTTPVDATTSDPIPPPPPTVVVDPEPAPTTVYTPTYTTVEPVYVEPEQPFLERYGVAFVLGGGVEGFTQDGARANTNDGGNWNARAIFGTRDWVGFEAAYIGSAQSIDTFGLDNDALLIGNGVQGNLRLNLTTDSVVQPFAFAGAAWRRYDLQNASINTSAVRDQDDVLEIPMGVGLAYKMEGFMIDARGEFRAATNDDLLSDLDASDNGLHRWGVNANIGYAF